MRVAPVVDQPNDGFADDRIEGGLARLHFNVNKHYGVYGGGTTAGDGVLIYPGKEGPLASSRSETWRDGFEDIELFARLPMAQRRELVHKLVAGMTRWEDDPVQLEATRREAAGMILSGVV